MRFRIRACGTGGSAEFLQNEVSLVPPISHMPQDGPGDVIDIMPDGVIYIDKLSECPGGRLIRQDVVDRKSVV